MNDETKQLLGEYLKRLLEAAETGVDFAAEQIPLVIQEKLTFDLAVAEVWMVVAVLSMVVFTITARWSLKKYKASKHPYKDHIQQYGVAEWLFATIPSIILVAVMVPVFLANLFTVLKISFAPRLYILEWLRGML